jgi:hypothetical protein
MTTHRFRPSRVGLAATAALGFTLATATPAFAGPEAAAPAPATSVANDTLTVMGTSASDRLALRLAAGDANTLQIDFGDDGSADASFDRRTFSTINVFLLAGNDQFRVDQTNGAFADEALTVDGGSGDDTMLGGDGNETFVGGSGSDFVDGNRGHDTAFLGSGEDTFKWDPGDGSDDVDGGSGHDTMVFNGANVAERMSLFADGSRAVFLRDPGTVRMNMDGVEQLDVHALGGADAVTIADTSGTDLRKVNLDLSATGVGDGDNSIDTVTVTGTDDADHVRVHARGDDVHVHGLHPDVRITGNEPTDELHVNTLDGNDHVHVDDAVADRITLNVDLGAGQH